ncbi:MAG: alpha-galactosidase [Defluviitaleaceae bacterium]|nr:alpha-galactosidase [Defluviitaleaceae bacterium]
MKSFSNSRVEFADNETKGVCYTSGANVLSECLAGGRYLVGMRSANGRVRRDWRTPWNDSGWVKWLIGSAPVEAFRLEMDGQNLNSHWEWESGEAFEYNKGSHAVVSLKHGVRPVKVKLHTRCDGTNFMERWIDITNTSDKPAALSNVSPAAGMLWQMPNYKRATDGHCKSIYTLVYTNETKPGWEGNLTWKPLENGEFSFANATGRSGWGVPYFMLQNRLNGENFVCHLEWSANWKFSFLVDQEEHAADSRIYFSMGPHAAPPLVLIAPGETVASPVVHLAHIVGDTDACVQETHAHIRRSAMLPAPPEKRLMIGQGRVIMGNEDYVKRQVDTAKKMGLEFYEIDAGWYGLDSNNWWPGKRGDWDARNWNPNGLDVIREYIHSKGMLFGLWMEPEAFGSESEIRKLHPDWLIKLDNFERSSDMIDLSKPEVSDWVEAEMVRVIREYRPDYFKIDFNSGSAGEEGNYVKDGYVVNTQWGHVKALYKIFDRLAKEFPDVAFENCAAGGGRNDLGMVKRTHISCQTDYTEQPANVLGLNGMTIIYPPELLRHYYPMNRDYSLYGDMDYHFRVMMLSNIFVIEAVRDMEENENDVRMGIYKKYVGLYKNFVRSLIVGCDVYHHTPRANISRDNGWCVIEYAAPDADAALVMLFRNYDYAETEYVFRPRGLDPGKKYKTTFDNESRFIELQGIDLINTGIAIRLERALTSQMLLFKCF